MFSGWGTNEYSDITSLPYTEQLKRTSCHTLQQAEMPVIDVEPDCNTKRICAGRKPDNNTSHPSSCRGDSGGPLVCQQRDHQWQLEGVISSGYKHCRYYTRCTPVSKYLTWINGYINGNATKT